jgi:peptidoglycan/xylan/chitin deacetylase (PgdA/CDA1 family)
MLKFKNNFKDCLIFIGSKINHIFSRDNGDRVIALHDVPSIDVFREKMTWLKSNYSLVSIDAILSSKPPGSKKRILLTFDDGYENWLTNAAPVLRELHVPAIFFVNSGLINLDGLNESIFLKDKLLRKQSIKLISMKSLIELSRDPLFEIGGHSENHLNLAGIKSDEELYGEIAGDKLRLEGIIGKEIRWFAYPFGGIHHFNGNVAKVVKLAGYVGAFTILPSNFNYAGDKFKFGRDCLELGDSEANWSRRLNGGYDKLAKIYANISEYGRKR